MGKRKLQTSQDSNKKQKLENETFTPIDVNSQTKPISFKPCIVSVTEPVFPSLAYCIQNATTNNLLTIDIIDLANMLMETNDNFSDFYICLVHGLSRRGNEDCEYCSIFTKYTYTFVVKTRYHYFTLPPPKWYSPKVLNFVKTLFENSFKYTRSKNSCEHDKQKELGNYSSFIAMDFNEGSLSSLSTGKTSYIRNSILGFHTHGLRATLTIDSTLSPQYAIFPQSIFDSLEIACPLAIINRAPSLKNTCIYAVEVLRNPNPNDYTIRMNSYITEGLHADQDGDELTIFYLKHPNKNYPSHDMQMAITELKKFSWNGGIRHDFAYNPRYEFTQYLKYILYRYNDYFCKHNKLWKSLSGATSEKCSKLMHLGCSIYPREVDHFIRQLSEFIKKLDTQLAPMNDLLDGGGTIKDVVLSGAKGEQVHIETYLKNLYNINEERDEDMIKTFNHYINSGSKMSMNGAYQFVFLEAVNPLVMLGGHVFYNDKILLPNLIKSTAFAQYCFNSIACNFIFNYIANTCDKFVSETDIQDYLSNL